eukprot:2838917-Prymnesium_polylepis.1
MSGISALCARPAGSRLPALRRQDSGPKFDPQPSPCMGVWSSRDTCVPAVAVLGWGLEGFRMVPTSHKEARE